MKAVPVQGATVPHFTLPPASVRLAAKKDRLLSGMVSLADNPNQNHYLAGLGAVRNAEQWEPPAAIANDREALNWLAVAFPALNAGVLVEQAQVAGKHLIATVAEHLALSEKAVPPQELAAPVPGAPRQADEHVVSGSLPAGVGTTSGLHSVGAVSDVLTLSVTGQL
jgi:hypothetical protein